MAVKLEPGGRILLILLGLGLIGYGLNRYGYLNLSKWKGGSTSTAKVDTAKPLPTNASSDTNEVRVRLNIWVGCVGGLVANGGLDTAAGSIYADKGLKVSFKIIDDWTEGAAALATNNVDIMLTTTDVWGKDFGQLVDKGVNAHAVFMVDWSRGADGVIGAQGIKSIEDLAGKTVAFAPYTPSHFLLWNGLKSSGLTTEQRNEIFTKAVHTKDGIEPATLFAQQKVDAAVAWDPDMSDAVAKRPGSRKIYDTRVANRLIADILVVSDRFAASSPQTLIKFIQGWLEGVEFINKQPSRAHTLIGTIKDFNIPADLAKTMLEGVHLSDYADNQQFFGAQGADSDYANIFKMSQDMYRELRLIKRVADTESSVDRRYVASLSGKFPNSPSEAPLTYKEPPKGAQPIATQRKSIYFEPNSAQMGLDSRAVVDEIGDFMRAYENTVVGYRGQHRRYRHARTQHEPFQTACRRGEGLPGHQVPLPGNSHARHRQRAGPPAGQQRDTGRPREESPHRY